MAPPIDQLTPDGFDLQWGTNVVGAYSPIAKFKCFIRLYPLIQAIGSLLNKLCLPSSVQQRTRLTRRRASSRRRLPLVI